MSKNQTVSVLLKAATQSLQINSDSARLDAELLLCHSLNKERSFLFTWPDYVVEAPHLQHFDSLLTQRQRGVPTAYLLGYRDFWTLRLKVTHDTLIPRPETELLVETALEVLPQDKPVSILDLGTGTGAIALSLASERPLSSVLAVDVSNKALEIARQNALDNQITNVAFLQSNWFDALPEQQFDLIVSNPPYIENNDPHLNKGDVRFEPKLALTSGKDGFDDIRMIIKKSPMYLKSGGWLMFEHGYNQAEYSRSLLTEATCFTKITSKADLAGCDRISLAYLKSC